jgi:uncharacterized protein (TIGR00106 family)
LTIRSRRSQDQPVSGHTQPRWEQSGGVTVKVIVDLCVVPIGVGVHLTPYIAACEKVLSEAGLKIQLHPNGTAIEDQWEPVFAAIDSCHQAVQPWAAPACTPA